MGNDRSGEAPPVAQDLSGAEGGSGVTHAELIHSMKETLIRMCHSNARICEFAFKVNRNLKDLRKKTPASKAVYVVTLDRKLKEGAH